MPTTDAKVQVFDDFSGGEYGDLGPSKAPPNSFSGSNVILYRNGALGPRPGLKKLTASGVPAGKVWGFFSPGLPGKLLGLVVAGSVYSFADDSTALGAATHQCDLGATPTEFVTATWYDPNNDVWLTSPGDALYRIDWPTGASEAQPEDGVSSIGTRTVALVRDRLMAAGAVPEDSNAMRLYYSEAADFANTPGNYFDVGYFQPLHCLVEMQNSLLIGQRAHGWWALVGGTPDGTLRRINTTLDPGFQSEVVRDTAEVFFWAGFPSGGIPDPSLVVTDGAKFDDTTYRHLRLAGGQRFGCFISRYRNVLFNASEGNSAFLRANGAWCRLNYGVNISGPVTTTSDAWDALMVGGDGPSNAANFYNLRTGLDRPGFTSDTDAAPGDDSATPLNAYFSLPIWWHPESRDMRVRRVIIDFTKWNTGVSTNTMAVTLTPVSQYNLPSQATSINAVTQTWSEAGSLASTSGTRDRFVMRIGDQGHAAGFQVSLASLAGVAIDRISVEYEDGTGRPL